MGTLESKFSRNDIETLIESVSEWETLGNQEYHLMNMVKNAPMPPEDHEAYEMMSSIKEHFAKREREIKQSRELKQESATLLKAKLMIVRRDMGIDQLFEMSTDSSLSEPAVAEPPLAQPVSQQTTDALAEVQKKLERAEFFIKDMGVQSYYEKFLAEQKTSE